MLKVIATSLFATAAMIGPAQASKMDDYQTCWSTEATGILNKEGVTEDTLKKAVSWADGLCQDRAIDVWLEAGVEDQKSMREYMEVQLYNANPVEETQVAAVQLSLKPYELPRMKTRVGYNLMNQKAGFLCKYVWDVENARQLVETNRAHMVEGNTSCVTFDQSIEVERIQGAGTWTIEVRYINAEGKMITAYTSDRTFRTWSEWARMSCRLAGNSDSACYEDVRARQ